MSSYKFVHNLSQISRTDSFGQDEIRIDVPLSQMPEFFNLTGYIEVSINQPYTQTLTYYYDSTTFELKNTR